MAKVTPTPSVQFKFHTWKKTLKFCFTNNTIQVIQHVCAMHWENMCIHSVRKQKQDHVTLLANYTTLGFKAKGVSNIHKTITHLAT